MNPLLSDLGAVLQSPLGTVSLSALGTGGLAAFITHYLQQREANVFPVLYSGVDRLAEPNTAARFYAAANDMVMSVTEAWNAGRVADKEEVMLEKLRAGKAAVHGQDVLIQGKLLLAELKPHAKLLNSLRRAIGELDASWDYDSTDNYRTETYTETYTDSEGKTQTRTATRRVYEDTDHYFTFDHRAATRACEAIDAVLQFDTSAMYSPQLQTFRVEPATLDASHGGPYRSSSTAKTQGSRTERLYVRDTILEDRKATVSNEQLVTYLNSWLQSANLPKALNCANGQHAALRRAAPRSKPTMMESAPSYHYNTTSTSHSGPSGYQAAQVMLDPCNEAFEALNTALLHLGQCTANGETLAKLGRGETIAEWKGDAEDTAERALDLAVESYLALFPDSPINMDQRVRTSKTVWVGIIAALLGGVAGFVLNPQNGMVHW